MTTLVHLTPEANARRIVRAGIRARSRGWYDDDSDGVYCMPVLPSYTLTHQWVRELRRWQRRVLVAVDVRLPDDERVTVGRYGRPPLRVTSAEAVAVVRKLEDPRGWEVFVPRAIRPGEVRRIRPVRQGIGWRYQPDAHGRAPAPVPSACLRARTGRPGSGPATPATSRVRPCRR